ncbi:MAG TPA: hypothetical protein VJT15_06015, partial [Pyrinomonadaceae bacterium]|nr:hypothetical protein [Pyrinomonadaceae bacterium]
MSSANVIVPPDVNQLLAEREQVWTSFDRAQGLVEEFRKLCSQVPNVAPASLQLPASTSNPPAHLESAMQGIKKELMTVEKLNGEIRSCHEQIEAIKRSEKMTIALIVGGVLVVLVIFLIVA